MFETDQTYLAYELAYRSERLTGTRTGDRRHHASGRGARRRGGRRGTTR